MARVGQEEARTGTVEIVSADDGCVGGGMMAAAAETRENGVRRQVRRHRVSNTAPSICGRDGSDQSFCILCSYLAQNRQFYWAKEPFTREALHLRHWCPDGYTNTRPLFRRGRPGVGVLVGVDASEFEFELLGGEGPPGGANREGEGDDVTLGPTFCGGGGPLGGAYREGGGPEGGENVEGLLGGGPARSKCSGSVTSGPDDPSERARDDLRRDGPSSGLVA